VHGRADAHDAGVDVLLVDHTSVAQLLLEIGDLLLEHGLLVLGVVVLGVLGDVTELSGLLDPLGHLAPALAAQVLDSRLQIFQALRGEDCVTWHRKTSADCVPEGRESVATSFYAARTISRPFSAASAARA
jgi:hypothetical protein